MLETLILTLTLAAQQNAEARVEILHSNLSERSSSDLPGASSGKINKLQSTAVASNGRLALMVEDDQRIERLYVDGVEVLTDRQVAPWDASRTVSFRYNKLRVSEVGDLLIQLSTSGTNPSSKRSLVVRKDGNWTEILSTGDAFAGDPLLNVVSMTDSPFFSGGQVGFTATVESPNKERMVAVLGQDLIAQTATSIPDGQFDGSASAWSHFTNFGGRPSGGELTLTGSLENGAHVAAVNGNVVVQSGYPIPGSLTTELVAEVELLGYGGDGSNWLVATAESSAHRWILRDGVLFAETGLPIVHGSQLSWSYIQHAGSGPNGDWYVFGDSVWPSGGRDFSVVSNGEVLLHADDQLDANHDGDHLDDELRFVNWDRVTAIGIDDQGRLVMGALVGDYRASQLGSGTLRLRGDGPVLRHRVIEAGSSVAWGIFDAEPGASAIVGYSLVGSSPTSVDTGQGVVLMGLSPGWVSTGTKIIDAQGEAQWTKHVPAALSGATIWAQGLVADSSGLITTNAISATIQ